jgi:hypothetical protein
LETAARIPPEFLDAATDAVPRPANRKLDEFQPRGPHEWKNATLSPAASGLPQAIGSRATGDGR